MMVPIVLNREVKLTRTHARDYTYSVGYPECLLLDYGSLCDNKGHSSHRKYTQVCRHCSFLTIHMDCCN